MNHHPGYDQENKPNSKPHGIPDRYIFDEASGLYVPESSQPKKDGADSGSAFQIPSPLEIKVSRDWVSVIISALTLLLVAGTVFYTRSQWKTMDKTFGEIQQQTAYAGSGAQGTIAGAAAAASGAAGTLIAANAAKNQVTVMADQLKVMQSEHRPLVNVVLAAITGDLVRDDGNHQMRADIVFELRNVGNAVAQMVSVNPVLTTLQFGEKSQGDTCSNTAYSGHGFTLFPGEMSKPQNIVIHISQDELNAGAVPTGKTGKAFLEVIGCIDYSFGSPLVAHKTGFAYQFVKRGPDMFIPADIDRIPAADLGLTPMLMGTGDFFN